MTTLPAPSESPARCGLERYNDGKSYVCVRPVNHDGAHDGMERGALARLLAANIDPTPTEDCIR